MSPENKAFIINPHIAGSPIKDSAMFFGREDVYAWLRQHLRGKFQDNVIVLYGERRSGKTSILYQMKEQLGDDHYIPVLLDLQGMRLEGMDGFLWGVARKIVLALRGVEGLSLLDRPARRDFENNPREQFEQVFLPPLIASLGEHRHLLLMFDETHRLEDKVQAGDLPADVFDYLRALIQFASRLNFLFSLGSRIGEVEGLSQLFNLAVYRKISFLDQDFAEDLIIRPVAEYYTYTRPAIERILQLTSGQPYYTQLMCHNLFTRWAQDKPDQLDVADVEAVLSNVVEQGTPNLRFVWEDSTPVEQAILAALADRMPRYKAGVMRRNLLRSLHRAKLYPPDGHITTGLKTLFNRDVINNQEPYEFRVGLLQLWLSEFKRLEWIREELGKVAKQWERRERQRRIQSPTTVEQARRWAAIVMGGLLLGVLIFTWMLWQNLRQTEEESTAALDAAEARRLTEVAQLEATIVAANTEIAQAEAEESSQESAQMRATAQAEEAIAEIALARVTEVAQKEATSIAAAAEAEVAALAGRATEAAIAQNTATAAQAEVIALENITPTPTDTPPPTNTPRPTDTATATATPTPRPTATPRPTFSPTPAPQGRLAIAVDNGGRYDVNIYAVPGGSLLGKIWDARQPNFWKPDGKLAVNAGGDKAIWIYDSDGNNGRSISLSAGDSHPFWKPSGQGLVYDNNKIYFRDGDFVWSIYIQDMSDQASRTVERLAGDILDAYSPLYPLWANNDQIIFYACNYWFRGGGGRCGVWRTESRATVGRDGFRSPKSVTTQQEIPTDIYDNHILMMGQANGNWEVYLGSIESGVLKNLSNHPANDGLGTFSPDGRWAAFVSSRDGKWDVWIVPVSGGEATRLAIDDLKFGSGDRNWTTERISWRP